MDAITTDEFFTNQYYFVASGDRISSDDSVDRSTNLFQTEFDEGWQTEQHGNPIVVGEDPWYVSVEETWTSEDLHYEGTASYIIVDQDGTKKLAQYSYFATGFVTE